MDQDSILAEKELTVGVIQYLCTRAIHLTPIYWLRRTIRGICGVDDGRVDDNIAQTKCIDGHSNWTSDIEIVNDISCCVQYVNLLASVVSDKQLKIPARHFKKKTKKEQTQ